MAEKPDFKKDDREDLGLVRKTRKGNKNAFGKLVQKYQKRIYYRVREMVLDHSDTNDIVQDTFVKAYTKLHQYDERYPFYPWLHRIAINTALNHQTRASRKKETVRLDDEESLDIPITNSRSDPLNRVIQDEFTGRIALAMEQLPVDQRTVFVLRTSEGLSYQEISEHLDISMGTVMSRLSRAREKLKDLLLPYLNTNNIED